MKWLLFIAFITAVASSFKKDSDTFVSGDMNNSKGFAVVELFTSEGCSSCPPVDEAIAAIKTKFADNIYVLSFHVDYWNYLGWKDEFSDAAYSQRQQLYSSVFRLNSVYTPQVIINGKKEFVGSEKDRLDKEVQNEIQTTKNLTFFINASGSDDRRATIRYAVERNTATVLNIVLIQLNAESNVKRGENKGLKLNHVNVVRGFKTVSLDKTPSGSVTMEIPEGLDKKDCIVIAFLQDKSSLDIISAGKVIIN